MGFVFFRTGFAHVAEAAIWSCDPCHLQRLRLDHFAWNFFTRLKDLLVFNTLCSPTRDNINKPSLEKVTCFDHSFVLPASLA